MERPYTLDHLDHVVLRVRDLARSLRFYEMIGGAIQGEVNAGTLVRITSGQSIILQERVDHFQPGLKTARPMAPSSKLTSSSWPASCPKGRTSSGESRLFLTSPAMGFSCR